MLIDFHTHAPIGPRYDGRDDVCVIQSLMPDEHPDPRANFMTFGIHPMHPDAPLWMDEYRSNPDKCIGHLITTIQELQSEHPETPLIGIGECGWDNRSTRMTMEEQTRLFRLHDAVSRALMLPLILHVVGGWHLLLSERIHSPHSRWYVHGFRSKAALLSQLLEADIRISFGPLYDWSYRPPLGTFFLETDESDTPIETVYEQVSRHYKISVTELRKQILYCFNDM